MFPNGLHVLPQWDFFNLFMLKDIFQMIVAYWSYVWQLIPIVLILIFLWYSLNHWCLAQKHLRMLHKFHRHSENRSLASMSSENGWWNKDLSFMWDQDLISISSSIYEYQLSDMCLQATVKSPHCLWTSYLFKCSINSAWFTRL